MFSRCVFPLAVPLLLVATGADAAPDAKRKPPAEISIENGRKVALDKFEVVAEETAPRKGAKPKRPSPPVLRLEEPLPPGEKKLVKLVGAKGCSYRARWAFADVGDEAPIDLCGDPKIVLTD